MTADEQFVEFHCHHCGKTELPLERHNVLIMNKLVVFYFVPLAVSLHAIIGIVWSSFVHLVRLKRGH
jgi:hypothetical protein